MANRIHRHETNLNERIAAIRENNARLENRHREIEMDKKRAFETGSSILPSQIKITISRNDKKSNRNSAYENGSFRGKIRQTYRSRGGGVGGPLEYNLSKSLSRLPHDMNSYSQPQSQSGRQRGGGYGANVRSFYVRGGGNVTNFSPDYVRYVEIDRYSQRACKPQRYSQNYNKHYYGLRNGQQQTITPAKSMPSLNPTLQRQNPRSFNNNQARGGAGNFRTQNLPPRSRYSSHKAQPNGSGGGGGGGTYRPRPPPPPPFPPPSPSQPTSSQKWVSHYALKDRSTPWVRGMVIKSQNPVCRVAAVSTRDDEVSKYVPENDSPFINPDEDDDDGYIDDNPLEDLDQFTLKIDMDGGFIVHDAAICDPILSKPISSWIDDVANEFNESYTEAKDFAKKSNASNRTNGTSKSPGRDALDFDGLIFSSSSLTTSGVSTMSSLDCRIVSDDFYVQPIQRSYSADQLDKVPKPRRTLCFQKESKYLQVAWET